MGQGIIYIYKHKCNSWSNHIGTITSALIKRKTKVTLEQLPTKNYLLLKMNNSKNISTRPMKAKDWDSVSAIYKDGIATGFATFETSTPSYSDWDAAHLKNCRIIAHNLDQITGWAALSPVSSRCVYGGIAEVSVYIAKNSRGLGVGKLLMERLILDSEKVGLWTLQSGIFPENIASIKLHEKVGFRYIGKREKIGKTNEGVWKDNLLFERRSTLIGID